MAFLKLRLQRKATKKFASLCVDGLYSPNALVADYESFLSEDREHREQILLYFGFVLQQSTNVLFRGVKLKLSLDLGRFHTGP